MKKIIVAVTLVMFLGFPAWGFANEVFGKGGFQGAINITSVADAKELRDDSKVILEGNIIKYLGHERYEFQDKTGIVVIEIDDDEWNGQIVRPEDTVTIYGEVERDFKDFHVEVEKLVKK